MSQYNTRSKGPVNPTMFISNGAKLYAMQLTNAPGNRNNGDWNKWQIAGRQMNGYEFSHYAQNYDKRKRKRDAQFTCSLCSEYSLISVSNGKCDNEAQCQMKQQFNEAKKIINCRLEGT